MSAAAVARLRRGIDSLTEKLVELDENAEVIDAQNEVTVDSLATLMEKTYEKIMELE